MVRAENPSTFVRALLGGEGRELIHVSEGKEIPEWKPARREHLRRSGGWLQHEPFLELYSNCWKHSTNTWLQELQLYWFA